MIMDNIQNLLNQIAEMSKKHSEILDALDATGGRFNMFKICEVNHYENTHSAIIVEFLSPDGSHGLKAKFLECFVNKFCEKDLKQGFNCENARVKTEHHTGDDGRIDILIEDEKGHAIIIENKIYADDQWEQLKRYNNFAKKNYSDGNDGKENYQIFYLTLSGGKASEQSSQGVEYTRISYRTEIITWLEECVCIAARFPMVRETIIQYINHLKSLTHQDINMKNRDEILELLCKSEENVESVFIIMDNFTSEEVKNYLINKVFLPQLKNVCEKLGLKIEENVDRGWANEKQTSFLIKNELWKNFCIAFEFECIGLRQLIVGINHPNYNEGKETFEELKKIFPNTMYKHDETWGVYKDFPIPNWDKDAMIDILNGEMVKLFEVEIEKILEQTKDLDM